MENDKEHSDLIHNGSYENTLVMTDGINRHRTKDEEIQISRIWKSLW